MTCDTTRTARKMAQLFQNLQNLLPRRGNFTRFWKMVSAERSFGRSFCFGGGGVRGEVFAEVFREVFREVFGLVLLGHSEQKKLQRKLQPRIPMTLHSKTREISGKNFMTRFCRGTLAKRFRGVQMWFANFCVNHWIVGPREKYWSDFATLRACCRAQNPGIPKIRKNTNPPPSVGPRKKKYKNGPKTGGQRYVGDFVCLRIFGILGFLGSVAGPKGRKSD